MNDLLKFSIVILFLILIVGCWGCGSLNPTPAYSSRRSDKSVSQMVDDRVKEELPKALSSIIGQNVIDWGPYGIAGLCALLYGKKHMDMKNIIKKHGQGKNIG